MYSELGAVQQLICPIGRRGLVGKMVRIPLSRKHTLGLVFIHWVEYTLQGGSSQYLVLWSVWNGHLMLIALTCYRGSFPCLRTEIIFKANKTSALRRKLLQWVSSWGPISKLSLLTELPTAQQLICTRCRRGLDGKMVRIPFRRKQALGLVIIT